MFGPVPRDYSFKLNKKLKRAALKSALSAKVADENMIVVDQFGFDQIKTKQITQMLDALKVEGKALIITCDKDDNVVLSARNIPTAATTFASALNTYDVLNSDKVIVSKDAVAKIEEVYA